MGKIFKALEKSEKENAADPARESTTKRSVSRRETIASRAVKRDDSPADYRDPVPKRTRQDIKRSSIQKPTGRPEEIPSAAASPSNAAAKGPPVSHSSHNVKISPSKGKINSEIELPSEPMVTRPAHDQEANQKSEGVNIALVKPEVEEPQSASQRLERKKEIENIPAEEAGSARSNSRKKVSVRYSRTKIQFNDPAILRNNQVLSIFDDMETSNQFKILRTQILKKLKGFGGNSILVTSANPYEGKTFTSINLGVSVAKEFDRTVLIIDADLRKPTQKHTQFSTGFFSLKVEKGLTDYLDGEADISDILINPGIEKLTLIPGGRPVENSPELLNSGRMEEMMAEIKSRYSSDRLVIVDGPAILPFPDAMILSRYVDGVLVVVESEKTSTEEIKKMMNLLTEAKVLGVVMNKDRE